jgi:hypothetical protein
MLMQQTRIRSSDDKIDGELLKKKDIVELSSTTKVHPSVRPFTPESWQGSLSP